MILIMIRHIAHIVVPLRTLCLLSHTHTHTHTHARTHARTHAYHTHTHTHARTHARTHTLTQTHTHVHTHAHTHTHARTHTHTHTFNRHTHFRERPNKYIHINLLENSWSLQVKERKEKGRQKRMKFGLDEMGTGSYI